MKLSDAQRRAIRTLLQTGTVGVLITLYNEFAPMSLNTGQQAALLAFGAVIVSFLQNWLEDNVEHMPALLKSPASPGLEAMPEGKKTP